MANYCPMMRSNYFKVKDVEAFKTWLKDFPDLDFNTRTMEDGTVLHSVYDTSGEIGLPSFASHREQFDENGDLIEGTDDVDVDFMGELARHLDDDYVAICKEIGNEKLKYLTGFAIAINSKGERAEISLNDIYDLAAKLGKIVTEAEY